MLSTIIRPRFPVHRLVGPIILGAIWIYCSRLDAVPRSFGDEAWYAQPTIEWINHGVFRIPILPGRGGIDHFYLQPKIGLNILATPIVRFFGVSLFSFRLTSVLIGILGLCGVYRLSCLLSGSRKQALLSVGLATINPWFFVASRTFRPEIFVATFSVWYATFLLQALQTRSHKNAVGAGAAAGIALLCHQLSILVLAAISLSTIVTFSFSSPSIESDSSIRTNEPKLSIRTQLSLLAAATSSAALIIAPFVAYVIRVRSPAPVSFVQQFMGESEAGMSLRPFAILRKEWFRWANFLQLPLGYPVAAIYFFASARAILSHSWQGRWTVGVVVLQCFALGFGVSIMHGRYIVPLIPFLVILVSQLAYDPDPFGAGSVDAGGGESIRYPRRRIVTRTVILVLVLLYATSSVGGVALLEYFHRDASYDVIKRSLRPYIRPGDVVAGPIVFALAVYPNEFVVTNIPPSFADDGSSSFAWLRERLALRRPDKLLETTSLLQSTDGLQRRPTDFRKMSNHVILTEFIQQGRATLRGTLESADFGPIRVWQFGNMRSDGSGVK